MDITEQDKLILKAIVGDVFDTKIAPFDKKMENMNILLTNHLQHNALQFGEVCSDIKWLKDFYDQNKNGAGKSNNEGKQNANIDWLTWGTRLLIGTLVTEAIAIIFLAVKVFIK